MTPLLNSIDNDLIETLRKRGKQRHFRENEEIFAGGDEAAFLPVVLSGQVKMIHFLEPGKEVIVGIFQDGEMFAVPPVFDGGQYPATAIAMEDTHLLMVYRKDFLDLLRNSSEFSFAVIDWMCGMLREKTATIQNLATASPEQRVGKVLLRLAERNPGGLPIKITLKRQDIARMAGLTTETTIRVIRKLAEQELITITHGKIYVGSTGPLQDHVQN